MLKLTQSLGQPCEFYLLARLVLLSLGPAFLQGIPIRVLDLAHDLGQPCANFVPQPAAAAHDVRRVLLRAEPQPYVPRRQGEGGARLRQRRADESEKKRQD